MDLFGEGVALAAALVSREGLITLKLAAGRPQDIVDIQRLQEASHGGDDT